jgi:hypothetical protein
VLVFVYLKLGLGRRIPYRRLLVVDAAGRTLASMQALRRRYYASSYGPPFESVWPNDDLSKLSAAAGLDYHEEEFPDTEALQDAHPGAMKGYRFYAHPNRYMLLVTLAVIAVVVVAILIVNLA